MGNAERDGDVCGDPAVINKDTTCCCCWYVRDGDPGGDIAPSAKAMSLLECEERLLRRGVEGESETDRSDSDPSPELTKSGGESCAASEVPGKKGDRDSRSASTGITLAKGKH